MIPDERVAVVYAPRGAATLRELLRAADGIELTLVMRDTVAARHPELCEVARRLFGEVVTCSDDGTTASPLDVNGITTFSDQELPLTARVAARAGLDWGVPDMAVDKLSQRQTLVAAGLSKIRAVAVESPQDFERALRLLGVPGVLKPRYGFGGDRVTVVTHASVRPVAHRWDGLLYENWIPDASQRQGPSWLADFVSVEVAATRNQVEPLTVFAKLAAAHVRLPEGPAAARLVTTGDVLPHGLPERLADDVRELACRAVQALGIRSGAAHVEVKLGADGPEIIEVNCRTGGHLARLLNRHAHYDLIRAALKLALGHRVLAPQVAAGSPSVAGVFVPFPNRGGVVASRVSLADLRGLPGVAVVGEVAQYGADRADSDGIAANVVLSAPTLCELAGCLRRYLTALSELFAADGLERSRWIFEMTAALALAEGQDDEYR